MKVVGKQLLYELDVCYWLVMNVDGEVIDCVLVGIDFGWDYNVGQLWFGFDMVFGQKLVSLLVDMQNNVVMNLVGLEYCEVMVQCWCNWFDKLVMLLQLVEFVVVGFMEVELFVVIVQEFLMYIIEFLVVVVQLVVDEVVVLVGYKVLLVSWL